MMGDGAASHQRGAAETYAQHVMRLRGGGGRPEARPELPLSQEWHAALRDCIEAIESELNQLGEKQQ